MPTFAPRNVTAFRAPLFYEHVRRSVLDWIKEGFAAITDGAPAANTPLLPVKDERYPQGWPTGSRVWESRRSQWAWESGGGAAAFTPTTGGLPATGAKVCPDRGRLLFPAPIPAEAAVLCPRRERMVHGYLFSEPWVGKLDVLSMWTGGDARPSGAGDMAVLNQHRVQMPCVVVQEAGGVRGNPYEVGGPAHHVWCDLALHCLAESPTDRTWLHDALAGQMGTVIPTFDAGLEGPPFDADGGLLPGAKSFQGRCASTPWRSLTVESVRSGEFGASGSLHWATVIWTLYVGVH